MEDRMEDREEHGLPTNKWEVPTMELDEILASKLPKLRPRRGIYFLLRSQRVVYVGQSTDIQSRLSSHCGGDKDFESYTFLELPSASQEELSHLELLYIVKFQPEYNKNVPPNQRYMSKALIKRACGFKTTHEVTRIIKRKNLFPVWGKRYDLFEFIGGGSAKTV